MYNNGMKSETKDTVLEKERTVIVYKSGSNIYIYYNRLLFKVFLLVCLC